MNKETKEYLETKIKNDYYACTDDFEGDNKIFELINISIDLGLKEIARWLINEYGQKTSEPEGKILMLENIKNSVN